MLVKILKPIYKGGKEYFKEGQRIRVMEYCDRVFYKKAGTKIMLPKGSYEEVKE